MPSPIHPVRCQPGDGSYRVAVLEGPTSTGVVSERVLTRPFLLLTIAMFGMLIAIAAVLPVLPRYLTDAGAGEAAVGVTIGVFGVSALLMRPIVGRLADTRGRRPVLLAGAAVFTVVTLLYAVSPAVPYLIVLRLASGAAEAAVFVAATTAVADLAPPSRRGEAMSLFSVAIYTGLAAGPVLGEQLYATIGRGAFIGAGAAALLGATLMAVGLPETAAPRTADDPPPPVRRGLSRLGFEPAALLPGGIIALVVVGQGTFNAFLPLLTDETGTGPASAAYATFGVAVVVLRIVGRTWPDRFDVRRASTVAVLTAAAGIALIGWVASLSGLLLATLVMAGGQSLAFPVLSVAAVNRCAPGDRGRAMATVTACLDVAFSLSPVIAGAVAAQAGLRAAFVTSGALVLLGLPLALRIQPASAGATVPAQDRLGGGPPG